MILGEVSKVWPVMCRNRSDVQFVDVIFARQYEDGGHSSHSVPPINYSVVIHLRAAEFGDRFKSAQALLQSVKFQHPKGLD